MLDIVKIIRKWANISEIEIRKKYDFFVFFDGLDESENSLSEGPGSSGWSRHIQDQSGSKV